MVENLFTSEAVSEGHPDKMCDQISDALLDAYLTKDPSSRVAIETFVKTGMVIVGGEVTSRAHINVAEIIRKTVCDIGYTSSDIGFDGRSCGILNCIEGQSPDIAMGVDAKEDKEQGAGDQGMMFGYACDETPELMPAPIAYAHELIRCLTDLRKKKHVEWLRPDAKSQVTFAYNHGEIARVDTVVISTQHIGSVDQLFIQAYVTENVIKPVLGNYWNKDVKVYVNPTGRFVIGGPMGDTGVTGRKIIVDTYGGMGRHGGGAFSGKDPSKVDRSAAYYARYIAKNIVAADLASRCEVQLAYAIGIAKPVSMLVDTFGTAKHNFSDYQISKAVMETFDARPASIIKKLDLLRPIYQETASGGHFGRVEFPWEATDKIEALTTGYLA